MDMREGRDTVEPCDRLPSEAAPPAEHEPMEFALRGWAVLQRARSISRKLKQRLDELSGA